MSQKWFLGQRFSPGMPEELHSGLQFTSSLGLVKIHHQVDVAKPNCLRGIIISRKGAKTQRKSLCLGVKFKEIHPTNLLAALLFSG